MCFYSAEEYDDERILASKCGPVYLRSRVRIPESELSLSSSILTLNFEDRITKYAKDRIARGPGKLLKVRGWERMWVARRRGLALRAPKGGVL